MTLRVPRVKLDDPELAIESLQLAVEVLRRSGCDVARIEEHLSVAISFTRFGRNDKAIHFLDSALGGVETSSPGLLDLASAVRMLRRNSARLIEMGGTIEEGDLVEQAIKSLVSEDRPAATTLLEEALDRFAGAIAQSRTRILATVSVMLDEAQEDGVPLESGQDRLDAVGQMLDEGRNLDAFASLVGLRDDVRMMRESHFPQLLGGDHPRYGPGSDLTTGQGRVLLKIRMLERKLDPDLIPSQLLDDVEQSLRTVAYLIGEGNNSLPLQIPRGSIPVLGPTMCPSCGTTVPAGTLMMSCSCGARVHLSCLKPGQRCPSCTSGMPRGSQTRFEAAENMLREIDTRIDLSISGSMSLLDEASSTVPSINIRRDDC